MKSIIGAFVLTLFVVCLALPSLVFAGAEGASATGSFKFVLEDGETRFVEFDATEGADGQATGEMTFSDPVAIPVEDPDDSETPKNQGVLVVGKAQGDAALVEICIDFAQAEVVLVPGGCGGAVLDGDVICAGRLEQGHR